MTERGRRQTDGGWADDTDDRRGGWDDGYDQGHDGRYDNRYDNHYDDRYNDYDDYEERPEPRRSRLRAWAPLVFLTVVLSLFGGCVYAGYSMLKSKTEAKDFAGRACATDQKSVAQDVQVEVRQGDTGTKIANRLVDAGVIASVGSYLTATNKNESSGNIQAGVYTLCKGLSADAAVSELLKSANRSDFSRLVIVPGWWKSQVYKALELDLNALHAAGDKKTFTDADFAAAEKSGMIDLPSWANGDIEGFMEPATYNLSTTETPEAALKAIVDQRLATFQSMGLTTDAKGTPNPSAPLPACGHAKCSLYQVLIIASMAQAEVSTKDDASRVAEAVNLRLADTGYLGIDATTVYWLGKPGVPPKTVQVDDPKDPYSTGAGSGHKGLPPSPIGNPGDEVLQGVLTPATDKAYYYWCGIDGITKFYTKAQGAQQRKDCASQAGTATSTKK